MAQSAAAEHGGHGVCGEQRGLPPEGQYCLISVIVNVQNVVTFLNFFCSYCAWVQDEKLILSSPTHAASQETPVKREERQEVGGRGWDGRELLLLKQS